MDQAKNQTDIHLTFIKPKPVRKGDLVINELLFNPFPYGVDFVELYNISSFYLELKDAKVVNQSAVEKQLNSLLMSPGAYVVLSADSHAVQEFYPRAAPHVFLNAPLSSFPDDKGSVTLLDNQGAEVDRLVYTHTMHNPLLENEEGTSLERVNVSVSSDWISNWQSASTSSGGATPGHVNSQTASLEEGGMFKVDPHAIAPGVDGYQNYATIHYMLPKSGGSIRMDIYSLQGIWICSLQPSGPSDRNGFCTWNGTNANLQPVNTGLYLLVAEFFHPDGDHAKFKETISVLLR
jgi:hypothetical protein